MDSDLRARGQSIYFTTMCALRFFIFFVPPGYEGNTYKGSKFPLKGRKVVLAEQFDRKVDVYYALGKRHDTENMVETKNHRIF